jgi:hypothetical protein
MPNNIVSMYNGLLPTWLYGFQFAVNQQLGTSVPFIGPTTIALSIAVLLAAMLAGYVAWVQRVVNGYRRHRLAVDGLGAGRGAGAAGDGAAAGTGGGAAGDGAADGTGGGAAGDGA